MANPQGSDDFEELTGRLWAMADDIDGSIAVSSHELRRIAGSLEQLLKRREVKHREWGVRKVNVKGTAHVAGTIESVGVKPGGQVGQFTEDECYYIAGAKHDVVTRMVTTYIPKRTDWELARPAVPVLSVDAEDPEAEAARYAEAVKAWAEWQEKS